jgi:hypothetical protein
MMSEKQLAKLFEHQVVHVSASSLFMYAPVNCSLVLNLLFEKVADRIVSIGWP